MNKLSAQCTIIENTVNAVHGFHKVKYKGLKIRLPEQKDNEQMKQKYDKLLDFIHAECNKVGILPFVIYRILFDTVNKKTHDNKEKVK